MGLVIGFFTGRWMLERRWNQPLVQLSSEERSRLAAADADPVPAAGSSVLIPMPLERARVAMRAMTRNDPLVMVVGAVGNSDDGAELHVDLENKGKCTVTAYSGVAYGFDAWGNPVKINKAGEQFVAFSGEKVEIAPGKRFMHESKLRYSETASLVVAHVDSFECKDGAPWKRQ